MRFYYSSQRTSPLLALLILAALVLLIPLISGFFLLALATAAIGWIALSLRRGFAGALGKTSKEPPHDRFQEMNSVRVHEAKVVVIDRNDNVIEIQDS
jgi:hypothetical protein